MKKSKGIVSLVLIAALLGLLGFTCWQGFGSSHTGSARNINLGLDLAGGVSITYQAKDKNPSAEDMKDTIYKLQKRVEQYSTEASVYQEGDDRINIEIPDHKNHLIRLHTCMRLPYTRHCSRILQNISCIFLWYIHCSNGTHLRSPVL